MGRDIDNRLLSGLNPFRPRPATPAPQQTGPISADAAARRTPVASDRQSLGGGTGSSRLQLGGGATPASERPRSARNFDRFLMNQYDGKDKNACGTTSMSMLLNFWKNQPGAYHHGQLDETMRRGPDMYSSPTNLIDYARSQGFRAEGQNGSSLADLQGYLDKGVPVQVLIDPDNDGGDSTLHYVDVTDYEADADGNMTSVTIADPAGGREKTMPIEEFQEKWGSLKLGGLPTGIDNYMNVVLPGENTPVVGKDGVVRNSDDIELPPQGSLLSRALGLELGVGVALADVGSDIVNEAAETIDEIKDIGGKVADGAKRVGSWLNPFG